MKRKLLIVTAILLVIASIAVAATVLTAGKGTWSTLHTQGERIMLTSSSGKATTIRWDYHTWDNVKKKYYLSYAQTTIQSGETLFMPYTDRIYIKTPKSKVVKIEGTHYDIIK